MRLFGFLTLTVVKKLSDDENYSRVFFVKIEILSCLFSGTEQYLYSHNLFGKLKTFNLKSHFNIFSPKVRFDHLHE